MTNHSTVHVWPVSHASMTKRFSRGNISIESSTAVNFRWSISWSIGQRSIKKKNWLPLFSYCCLHQSVPLSLADCLLFILFETDHLCGLQFPHHSSLLVQDNIRMTVSRWPDCNYTQKAEEEVLAVPAKHLRSVWLVGYFTLFIWQVHIQTDEQNMTGSLLKHTAQSPTCACSV